MKLGDRIDKLESALSPRAATLLWLTEAHGFGSLPQYADWLSDQPLSAVPLERVPSSAEAWAVAATKGQPPQVVYETTRKAIRDAIFLVDLVVEINGATHEATRLEGQRYAATFWEMRSLTLERRLAALRPDDDRTDHAEKWADWLARAKSWLIELYAVEDARILLESRYFDGHAVLFPEQAAEWTSLREGAESLVGVAHTMPAEVPSGRRGRTRRTRPAGLDLKALRASAAEAASEAATRWADRAQTLTLDSIGDSAGAMEIAKRQIKSA